MRKDMAKVIVERPRYGHSDGHPRGGRTRVVTDDDGAPLPARVPAQRRDWKTKNLNENLAPLRRFLMSQAERPWNKVYAEISAHLKPTSTVQQHVRDHIEDIVAVRTRMADGVVMTSGRWGREQPLDRDWRALYVHPRTGLLRKNAKRYSYARAQREEREDAVRERADRVRELSYTRQLHHLADGNWYEVELASRPLAYYDRRGPGGTMRKGVTDAPYVDVVIQAGLGGDRAADVLYGRRGVYAVRKRTLSRKEKKAYGLV